jgi:hypothetical protein
VLWETKSEPEALIGDGCSIGVLERFLALEPKVVRRSVTFEFWPDGVIVFEVLTVALDLD